MRARFLTTEREKQTYDTLFFDTHGRKGGGIGIAEATSEKRILEAFVSPFWKRDKYFIFWEGMDLDDVIFTAQALIDFNVLEEYEYKLEKIEKPKIKAKEMGLKTNIMTEAEDGNTSKPMNKEELLELIHYEWLKDAIIEAVKNKRIIRKKLYEIINVEKAERIAAAGVSY